MEPKILESSQADYYQGNDVEAEYTNIPIDEFQPEQPCFKIAPQTDQPFSKTEPDDPNPEEPLYSESSVQEQLIGQE